MDTYKECVREMLRIETNLPRVGVKFDAETEEHVIYINYAPDLTAFYERFALIFSDCLNNLRIALDYLAFQLAIWNTEGKIVYPDRITFPIVRKPEAWTGIEGKELAEIHAFHQAKVASFQPYYRTHSESVEVFGRDSFHPLELLRELTTSDKHKLLTPVAIPATGVAGLNDPMAILFHILSAGAEREASGIRAARMEIKPIELGAEISRAKLPAHFPKDNVNVTGCVMPEICIAEGPYRPILPVINKLAAFVVKILREFEPLL